MYICRILFNIYKLKGAYQKILALSGHRKRDLQKTRLAEE
jgi:hypothetical protein